MKTLCAALIGAIALLVVVPSVAAGAKRAYPSWDKQINKPKRFEVLDDFADAAVLDKETGLVWEQSPETAPNPTDPQTWLNTQLSCNTRAVGGRRGWRLPTVQELASLLDPTQFSPALPSGHPFSNVQTLPEPQYWSATTDANVSSNAWAVDLLNGEVSGVRGKTLTLHVWCGRGGQGVDAQ